MSDEQILKLAKTFGFDDMIGERDDETDGVYWECWEEQLLKFARHLLDYGFSEGHKDGYELGIRDEHKFPENNGEEK